MDELVKTKVTEFFKSYPVRNWPKSQIIIQANDDPAGIYFIEEGSVSQYSINYRGDKVVVNVFHHPAFIPISWALNDIENSYFFETVRPSKLRCAPREDVVYFLRSNEDVAYDLLTRVYSGLEGVLMRMVHLMSSSAKVRIMYEIMIQAKRIKTGDMEKNVHLKIREFELGTYCGLTKETVSREFKKLKKQGLVSVSGKEIIIHSMKELEDALKKSV